MDKFCLTKYLFHTSKGYLTCRKIFRHLTDGFTYPLMEGILQNLMALKKHRSRPGLKPRTLGRMSRTLISRPPRTSSTYVSSQAPLQVYINSTSSSSRLEVLHCAEQFLAAMETAFCGMKFEWTMVASIHSLLYKK
jgi:hypothetical protein